MTLSEYELLERDFLSSSTYIGQGEIEIELQGPTPARLQE